MAGKKKKKPAKAAPKQSSTMTAPDAMDSSSLASFSTSASSSPSPSSSSSLASSSASSPSFPIITSVKASASSFHAPNGTMVKELNPIPPALAHPYVVGAQVWWGIGERIAADSQLVIDHKLALAENEQLRLQLRQFIDLSERVTKNDKQIDELRRENSELREQLKKMKEEMDDYKRRLEQGDIEREDAKRRHDRMCITAELVSTLEDKICTRVFGGGYHRRRRTPMADIMYIDEDGRNHEPWEEEWLHLRDWLHVKQMFGTTFDFCRFLQEMKKERNVVSHQTYRVHRDIEQLTAEVMAYCTDYEAEAVARIDRIAEQSVRESQKQRAGEERKEYQRKSACMMEMLRSLVGDNPFGS